MLPASQVFAEEIQVIQQTAEILDTSQPEEENNHAICENVPQMVENDAEQITLAPSPELIFANDAEPSGELDATLKLTDLSLKLTAGFNESYAFNAGDSSVSGWNADSSAKGHEFTYSLALAFSSNQSNFSGTGKLEAKVGDIQIHIPLHIIQNQSGSWADELTIWYPEENDTDIADTVKYVYRLDSDNNDIILYNILRLLAHRRA